MADEDQDPTPPEGIPVPSILSGWSVLEHRGAGQELADLAQRVQLLPGWQLVHRGTAVRREYEFSTEAEALRYLQFVATLSAGADWDADLELRNRIWVEVRIVRPSGLRLRSLDLDAAAELHSAARRLGSLLPGPRGPAPEGTPPASDDGSN